MTEVEPYTKAEIEAAAGELSAVLALLAEVEQRGWGVQFDKSGSGTWGAVADGHSSAFSYVVPDDFGAGVVTAVCHGRTLKLTGVEQHSEAVARIREFMAWPS